MARILYGVHGTANGHAIRALTVARHYPEHEFMFVSHAEGAAILGREFSVANHLNPCTIFRAHRVDTLATVISNVQFFGGKRTHLRSILRLIDTFKPDVAISDYEFLVPCACRHIGLPCLSLDHQHIITLCSHQLPRNQIVNSLMTGSAVRFLFSRASHFIVISFFRAPLKRGGAKLVPPLLRDSVLRIQPGEGKHVLAYQSTSTFKHFLSFLNKLGKPVKVYGFNSDRTEGNLQFRKYSEHGFLEDLASCSYVICGGGHTLISEALHYGKPVISFPIANAFEQYLNAHYIQKLGYGLLATDLNSTLGKLITSEEQLNRFRANIKRENFNGNAEVYSLLDHFILEKNLPPASAPLRVQAFSNS